jgi:WD40 repeat protein/serine/threonine protein kinase
MTVLHEEEIFQVARQINRPDVRQLYLEQVCGENDKLRARLDALLWVHDEENSFLAVPAVGPEGTGEYALEGSANGERAVRETAGDSVGPYKLLEEIGEGGMGVVFMAEQRQPIRRCVALKLVKPGMDTRQVIARFEAERQALALMDHPHIAHVLDAGTTPSGRPYFVMELVRGLAITDFCDQARLSNRQRLELFLQVCSAVQHAHTKGIIHRDLKPSNVLVTLHDGTPVPKVIDFGVAKALYHRLTDKTLVTGFAHLVGTPLYMAPEQAGLSGLDADIRADVYALGVLLYELLTGTTPFDRERLRTATREEALRIIQEEEPPRPSQRVSTLAADRAATVAESRQSDPRALSTSFRGELDWVVMKALEKDRNRRYETASAFAQDVQRYLQDEPIEARPPSPAYRFRKCFLRNKLVILAGTAVATALLLGTALSTWQAILATWATHDADVAREAADVARDNEAWHRKQAARERDRALEAKEDLDATVYAQTIALAYHEWQAGNVERARQLLAGCDPRFRHWEWHYLQRLCHAERLTIPAWVYQKACLFNYVAISPDGKRIAVGLNVWPHPGGHVKIYDARTGRKLRDLPGHRLHGIADVRFSPDGRRLVSVSGYSDGGYNETVPGEVKVWDLEGGDQPLCAFEGSINTAAFSADGSKLAWATRDGTVVVWDLDRKARLLELAAKAIVHEVAFSPDGKSLAAACRDKTVSVWDVTTGKLVQTLHGHVGAVLSVAYSPDGKRLATGSADRTVKVWDAASGRQVLTFGRHDSPVRSVAFSPRGDRIASAGQQAWLWDAANGQEAYSLRWPTKDLAFAPEGNRLVSCGQMLVKVWEVSSPPEVKTLARHDWFINTVAISPDRRLVASCANDLTARVSDARTGEVVSVFRGHKDMVRNVLFTPDGGQVISAGHDGLVRIWNARTAEEVRYFRGGHPRDVGITGLALSPDGRLVVSADDEGQVIVWERATGRECLRFQAHRDVVWRVAFSADGRRLVTGSEDRTVKVWDARTGKRLLTLGGHRGAVRAVLFSPDGRRIYSADYEGRAVRIWDAATGEAIRMLPHATPVYGVALSPDGRRLAAACGEGVLRIWDTGSYQDLLRLPGYSSNYHHVAFGPEGRLLVAGGNDRTVKLWDGTPLPPERIRQSQAGSLVRRLYEGLRLKHAVIEHLKEDSTLGADLRKIALSIADQIEEDPLLLNSLSWGVVKWDDGEAEAYRLAVGQAEEACRLVPDHGGYLNTLGVAYYRVGRYEEAVATLERASQARPKGGTAVDWFALAMSHHRLGHTERVREYYDRAITWWRHAEGLSNDKNRQLESFRSEAVALLGIDPTGDHFDPDASLRFHLEGDKLVRRGLLSRMQGDPSAQQAQLREAAECFRKAVELGRPVATVWPSYALLLCMLGEEQAHQEFCADLLKHHGKSDDVTICKYVVFCCKLAPHAVADWGPVVKLARKVVAARPRSAWAKADLAAVLVRAGRFDEAMKEFEKLRELRGEKGSPRDWLFLGLAHQGLGHLEEARAWLAKMVALGTPFPLHQWLMAPQAPNQEWQWWTYLDLELHRREAEALVKRSGEEKREGTPAPSGEP